jgi:hypothetical protein
MSTTATAPEPKTEPKADKGPVRRNVQRDVDKTRPRKSDNGHTAVEVATWTTRGGNLRRRVTCQCGDWTAEAYDDRAQKAHAKHVAQHVEQPQPEPAPKGDAKAAKKGAGK